MPEHISFGWSRHPVSALGEYLRFALLHRDRKAMFENAVGKVRKKRVFLVGNGPSLNGHNLDLLNGEDYFLCNHAENIAWTQGKHHPFYIASDRRVPEGFENGAPQLKAGTYFFEESLKPGLAAPFVESAEIIWFRRASGGALKRGISGRPWCSVAGGQTVLLSAAQIALYLGYREIYIIGCDLNYRAPQAYAYAISAEQRQKTVRNDEKMITNTNAAFLRLRREAEPYGILIANAGIGGNLESLPRRDFETLFG